MTQTTILSRRKNILLFFEILQNKETNDTKCYITFIDNLNGWVGNDDNNWQRALGICEKDFSNDNRAVAKEKPVRQK